MMASMSLPVGESSACSVMETTRMPLRRSMDLKATACSRFLVNRENFQTKMTSKGALGWLPSSIISLPELGPVRHAAALGLVHILAGHAVAVGLGEVLERPQLGGHGQVHVLPVAGDPGVEGRRCEWL